MKNHYYLKFAAMALIAVFIFTAYPQSVYAQTKKMEKAQQKALDQQYKKRMNIYKKEGWKLSGGSRTLEVALLEHYQKQAQSENNVEFTGQVSQCKSINICKNFALTNAQNRYASLASGNIRGRVTSMLRADANMPEIEIDKFIAAYENEVKAEVSGVLTESYSIVKENGDGTKSYETVFILNEEKAGMARKKAFERSLRETKIAIKEAEEISKFVNEGFSIE